MKRFLALAALMLIPALSGCTPSDTAANDGKTHITFGTGRDNGGAIHHRIAEFEKLHPDIQVDLLEMPPDTDTQHNQFATYLIAEDPTIDVYCVDVVWPAEFGSAGWAVPLEDRRTPQDWAGYLKGPLATCQYNGHTWAVPWYCDAGMLYYRKDLLDAAGLKPPQTWDDVVADCKQLQRPPDLYGYLGQWKQYEGLVCNLLEFVWGNGGDIFTPDGRITVDTPNNVEAIGEMSDWMNKDRITAPGINTYLEEESLNLFLAGKGVFLRSWPYAWAQIQTSPASKIKDKVSVCPMPHGPHGTYAATLGGWNLMLSKYSRHPEASWEFIKFLTDDTAEKATMLDASYLPSRDDLYSDPQIRAFMPVIDQFHKAFTAGRPRPVTPYYAQVSDTLQTTVSRALEGTETPSQVVKRAQAQLEAIPGLDRTRAASQ